MKTIFKPILFSTEMVNAILDGRKLLTRRTQGLEKINFNPDGWVFQNFSTDEKRTFAHFKKIGNEVVKALFGISKYKIGNILWVRETFDYSDNLEEPFWYKEKYQKEYLPEVSKKVKWKPSIHMPKEAARIFLEVTSVRCERLNEISLVDCKLEGVTYYQQDNPDVDDILALEAFMKLWESINGKDSWIKNPFVWVYEFKVIEKPQNWPV